MTVVGVLLLEAAAAGRRKWILTGATGCMRIVLITRHHHRNAIAGVGGASSFVWPRRTSARQSSSFSSPSSCCVVPRSWTPRHRRPHQLQHRFGPFSGNSFIIGSERSASRRNSSSTASAADPSEAPAVAHRQPLRVSRPTTTTEQTTRSHQHRADAALGAGGLLQSMKRETPPRNAALCVKLLQQWEKQITTHSSTSSSSTSKDVDPSMRAFLKGLINALVQQQQQQQQQQPSRAEHNMWGVRQASIVVHLLGKLSQHQQQNSTTTRQTKLWDATTQNRLLDWLGQSSTVEWIMGTDHPTIQDSSAQTPTNLKPVHVRATAHTLHALTRLSTTPAHYHYHWWRHLDAHWHAFLAKATAHEVSLVLSSVVAILQQQQHDSASAAEVIPIASWLHAMEQHAERLIQTAQEPCHISNLLWACGTLLPQQSTPKVMESMPNLIMAADNRATELVEYGTPQEVANALWGCAKLVGSRLPSVPPTTALPHNLLTQVEHHAKRLVTSNDSNAQTVANTAWAVATLRPPSATQLFHWIDHHAPYLFFQRLGHQDSTETTTTTTTNPRHQRRVTPQSIANTVWAFAQMQHAAPNLLRQLQDEQHCVWFLEHGDPQHVANLVSSCAKLQLQQQSSGDGSSEQFSCTTLLDEVNRQAGWLVAHEKTTPQHVANIMWSFATVAAATPLPPQSNNAKNPRVVLPYQFLEAVMRRAEWFVEHGDSQNVANFVWACAKLDLDFMALVPALEQHASRLVRHGTPQEVANLLWACATTTTRIVTSGFVFPNLLQAVQERASEVVRDADRPQVVANMAWALATLAGSGRRSDTAAQSLFQELNHRAAWFMETASPQEVANVVWACATQRGALTKTPCGPLFFQLERHAEHLFASESEARPQALTNTAWGCATLNYRAPNVFGLLLRRQSWIVHEGGPLEVANAALACALLGNQSQETHHVLLQALGGCCVQLSNNDDLNHTTERFLANACLALAISGVTPEYEPVLRQLYDMAMIHCSSNGGVVHDRALVQLAQTQLLSRADGVHLPEPPPTVMQATELAFQRLHPHGVSRSAGEISQLLLGLGVEHALEISPVNAPSSFGTDNKRNNSLLSIDLAIVTPEGTQIAIEFDGPVHFLRDAMANEHNDSEIIDRSITRIPNGTTQAKRRVLQKLGWTVISLDYRDYAEAKIAMRQRIWLVEELRAAGLVVPL